MQKCNYISLHDVLRLSRSTANMRAVGMSGSSCQKLSERLLLSESAADFCALLASAAQTLSGLKATYHKHERRVQCILLSV